MLNLTRITVGNGSVAFNREIEPKPETTSKVGNVTTVNSAVPSVPAHYQVSFWINSEWTESGMEFHNSFGLNCIVAEPNDRAAYRQVEDAAARLIAPMLRSLADSIEAELPKFDEQAKA